MASFHCYVTSPEGNHDTHIPEESHRMWNAKQCQKKHPSNIYKNILFITQTRKRSPSWVGKSTKIPVGPPWPCFGFHRKKFHSRGEAWQAKSAKLTGANTLSWCKRIAKHWWSWILSIYFFEKWTLEIYSWNSFELPWSSFMSYGQSCSSWVVGFLGAFLDSAFRNFFFSFLSLYSCHAFSDAGCHKASVTWSKTNMI